MTAEHEHQCERTIVSVVHDIDDLNQQLQDARIENGRLAVASAFALKQARNVVDMYRQLVMDTHEDQELHRRVTTAADDAINLGLAALTGRIATEALETP